MASSVAASEVKKIIIACEAGMGSSLMAANKLKRMLKKAGINGVDVKHSAVRAIPKDAQIVLSHEGLVQMARDKAPWAVCFSFKNFSNIPAFETITEALKTGADVVSEE